MLWLLLISLGLQSLILPQYQPPAPACIDPKVTNPPPGYSCVVFGH